MWYQQAYLQHNFDLATICAFKAVEQASSLHDDGLNEAISREDLGNMLVANAKFDEGITQLKAALQKFKSHETTEDFAGIMAREHEVNCYASLTKACLGMNQLKEAEGYCLSGLNRSQSLNGNLNVEAAGRSLAGLFEDLGEIKQRQSSFSAAKTAYKRALRLADGLLSCDDRKESVTMKLANLFEITGDDDAAEGVLEGSQWSRSLKSGDLGRQKHAQEAEKYYLSALEEARHDSCSALEPIACDALARAYATQNKFADAETACLKSIALRSQLHDSSQLTETKEYLAEIYLTQAKYQDSAKLLTELLLDAANFTSRYTKLRLITDLGISWNALHENAKALSCANEALNEVHNHSDLSALGVEARLRLSLLYLALGDFNQAKQVADDADEVFKHFVAANNPVHPLIASRLIELKAAVQAKDGKAMDMAKQPNWLWSDDLFEDTAKQRGDMLFGKAKQWYLDGDLKNAMVALDALVHLEPSTTRVLYLRAEVYAAANNWVAAIAELDRAISAKPHKLKLYKLRAQEYERIHQYDRALADYSFILKSESDPSILNARAAIYRKLGKFDLAKTDSQRAAALFAQEKSISQSKVGD